MNDKEFQTDHERAAYFLRAEVGMCGEALEVVSEDSAKALYNCSLDSIIILTREFGPEALGGFFPWGYELGKLGDSKLDMAYAERDASAFRVLCDEHDIVDGLLGSARNLYERGLASEVERDDSKRSDSVVEEASGDGRLTADQEIGYDRK
ncbi:hypothetical protein KAR91_45215 [Candidatus Pacearchaeota archaeon]|nr:hypothetical protein [Candidatus Pacearchaeota archaeon]